MRWHKGRLSTFHRAHKMKKKSLLRLITAELMKEKRTERGENPFFLPPGRRWRSPTFFPTPRLKASSRLCCRAAAGGTNKTAAEEKEAPAAATWVLVPALLVGPNLNSCDCRCFTSLAAVEGVLVASEVRWVSLLAATTVSKTVLMLR